MTGPDEGLKTETKEVVSVSEPAYDRLVKKHKSLLVSTQRLVMIDQNNVQRKDCTFSKSTTFDGVVIRKWEVEIFLEL